MVLYPSLLLVGLGKNIAYTEIHSD